MILLVSTLAHADDSAPSSAPLPGPAVGTPLPPELLVEAEKATRAYHTRLAVFGGVSLAAGGVAMAFTGGQALAPAGTDAVVFHAGLHNGVGGASNLAFGLAALGSEPPATYQRLASLRETMALNAGLDAGYVAAGVAMGLLGDEHPAIEGAGWGIAMQGLGLLVCDLIYWQTLPR